MRFGWLSLVAILISGQSIASQNATIEHRLQSCSVIQDKLERLVCYDKLSSRVLKKQAVNEFGANSQTPARPNKTSVPALTVEQQKQAFGQVKPAKDAIERIELTVKSVRKNPYGTMSFTFTNGQTWKQIDSRRFKVKTDDVIFIRKGALGSFLMGKEGRNSTIRVKRVN
ncbi:MAG: hypothetical protein ACPGUD_02980 [Parashewanella sp.]